MELGFEHSDARSLCVNKVFSRSQTNTSTSGARVHLRQLILVFCIYSEQGGSVAEWLACWTQSQKGPGSNRSRDAVG